MPSAKSITLGGEAHVFRLDPFGVARLEKETGHGVGTLVRRLIGLDFAHSDLVAIVRYGLIGAGMPVPDANATIDRLVIERPIVEVLPIAIAILEHFWFGDDPKAPGDDQP